MVVSLDVVYNEGMSTRCDDIQYVEKAWISSSKFEKNGNSNYLKDDESIFKLIAEYLKDRLLLRGGEKCKRKV